MIFFFHPAGNVLGERQHDVTASLLLQTYTPVVLFCFLVKNILDTDLNANSLPPVFPVSNSPPVFLTVDVFSFLALLLIVYFIFLPNSNKPG